MAETTPHAAPAAVKAAPTPPAALAHPATPAATPAAPPAVTPVGTTNSDAANPVTEGTPAEVDATIVKSRTFRSFRNPAATQQRRDRIQAVLMKEIADPFGFNPVPNEGTEKQFILVSAKTKLRVTLNDGSKEKPLLDMIVEQYDNKAGEFKQLIADRESFEYSNPAGFARATRTMFVRNAKLLDIEAIVAAL